MARLLALAILGVVLSASASANDTVYQAQIDGMVCAFCAYNVGKTIGMMPGVDTASVDVDLEKHRVVFHSEAPVVEEELAAAFADSGFTLSALQPIGSPTTVSMPYQGTPLFELDLDGIDTEKFEAVFEAVGEIASSQNLRLLIEAPEAKEIDVLMPILMGRKPAVNVHFSPIEESVIRLRMYPQASVAPQYR